MAQHHPIQPSENLVPCPLFLCPKPRWKPKHDIWFTTTPNEQPIEVDH